MDGRANARFSIPVVIMLLAIGLALSFGAAQPAYAAKASEGQGLTAGSSLSVMSSKGHLEAYASKYSYTWNGKVKKPKVTVEYWRYSGKRYICKGLKAGRDYKLTYPKSAKAGEKLIKVTGKGKYAGMKTYARFYIYPHKRTISSYKKSGTNVKLNWDTHPDSTNYYVFSFAPTASAAKDHVWNYTEVLFDGTNESQGKWLYGRCLSNKKIKSTWGAGHAKLSLKKYLKKSYKKKYVYVCICAVKLFKPKLELDGLPILMSTPTVKKIKL